MVLALSAVRFALAPAWAAVIEGKGEPPRSLWAGSWTHIDLDPAQNIVRLTKVVPTNTFVRLAACVTKVVSRPTFVPYAVCRARGELSPSMPNHAPRTANARTERACSSAKARKRNSRDCPWSRV